VVAYLWRPDNCGNARVFRFRTEHYKLAEARSKYTKRLQGNFTYIEMYTIATCEQVDAHGDAAVEEVWLDQNV
jgi:hypothetical protein